MAKIGYARAACLEGDNLKLQIDKLRDAGCAKVFVEQISGVATARPEFDAALRTLQAGDELVVIDIDRISRDFDTFRDSVADILARRATVSALDGSIDIS